ncbi:MAG: hypothetical protein QOE65_1348 [Solirubrobacteraceae bacterium]|jgi:hypothetical protein|nr:hypothetical protein [Solirubrobacteraceae bacterium]
MRLWALVAVGVLGLSATAWAGGELVTSSRQVRDGVLLGRDLQAGTLDSRQVGDGGLEARDLSAAARRELRGTQGPRGRTGPPGPIPQVDYSTVRATARAGGLSTAKASCRGGRLPLGGGMREGSGRLVLNSSYPSAARRAGPGWVVAVLNPDGAAHGFTAYAVCGRVG